MKQADPQKLVEAHRMKGLFRNGGWCHFSEAGCHLEESSFLDAYVSL